MAPVGVQRGGARVVIARGQVPVAFELTAFPARDEHHLGMGFKPHHAVQHLGANRLQHFGPVDVGFLVKPGLQFHHHRHFLAPAHAFSQQVHQFGVRPGAVNGLFDRQDVRVMHRFPKKGQYPAKAFKRLVNQHITLF